MKSLISWTTSETLNALPFLEKKLWRVKYEEKTWKVPLFAILMTHEPYLEALNCKTADITVKSYQIFIKHYGVLHIQGDFKNNSCKHLFNCEPQNLFATHNNLRTVWNVKNSFLQAQNCVPDIIHVPIT